MGKTVEIQDKSDTYCNCLTVRCGCRVQCAIPTKTINCMTIIDTLSQFRKS